MIKSDLKLSNAGSNAIYGILFMLINTVSLSVLDISAKVLRSEFSSSLIVFIYKFSLFIIILPWVLIEGTKRIRTKKLPFHVLRSLFGTAGVICFVHGLRYVNMADAAALENIQYIMVACIGLIFFHEKLTKTKLAAIVLGFVGAIIVVKPGFISQIFEHTSLTTKSEQESNYIFILLAISFWSVNTILVKILGNTEHNKTQMFYLLMFASLWSFPAAFIHWEKIEIFSAMIPLSPSWLNISNIAFSTKHLMLLALMGLCYFIHGIAYFNALKTDLSIVIPFRYTKLIFSALLGYLFFGEIENSYSYIGYFLIISASFILVRYEIRRKKKLKKVVVNTDDKQDTNINLSTKEV